MDGPTQADPRRWQALALLCLANLIVILDAQIVILGLPSIEADLGLSSDSGQWVMSAYLLRSCLRTRPFSASR
jgi:MFS family permease